MSVNENNQMVSLNNIRCDLCSSEDYEFLFEAGYRLDLGKMLYQLYLIIALYLSSAKSLRGVEDDEAISCF
jgi:hypothetical protein